MVDATDNRGLRRCTHAMGVAWAEVASARALGKEGAGLLSGARGNGVLAFRHGREQTRNGGACFLTRARNELKENQTWAGMDMGRRRLHSDAGKQGSELWALAF